MRHRQFFPGSEITAENGPQWYKKGGIVVAMKPPKNGGAVRGMSAVSRGLDVLETGLAALACVALAAIMLIVVVDVAMRYALSMPLGWSYDLIGLYLVVAVFFLMLPDTLHHHGHVAIDLFQGVLPRRFRHLGLAVGYAAGALVMALIGLEAWDRFQSSYAGQDRIAALVPWLTWPAYLIVLTGTALLTLRLIYRAVGHGLSIFSRLDLVEMPPPPETTALHGEDAL
ncbi:MAG: TRAP transporter small permease [Antarcticimicrobium sp.]|nr:TRAP transporter small permease [Antarcticimicrobium sp.]